LQLLQRLDQRCESFTTIMDWELEALKSCAPKKALRRPEPRAQAEDAVQAMLRARTR
jgi:hypothetical protein